MSMLTSHKRLNHWFIVSVGLLPLIYWAATYLNYDMWFDEVFSLQYFVLVPWDETVFNYAYPNNHIFLSVIGQIMTRILGMRDLLQLADQVYILRGFQLIVTGLCGLYCYRIVSEFFSEQSSGLVIAMLFTTIPFMNFSLQLRGYNLSALFLVLLIHQTWSYLKNGKNRILPVLALVTCAMLYSIPSDLYMILAFGFSVVLLAFKNDAKQRVVPVLVAGCMGIVLSIALYFPILEHVLNNRFVDEKAPSTFYALETGLVLLSGFVSERYLVLVCSLVGAVVFFRSNILVGEKKKALSLFLILVVPFVFAFFHQRFPFERVFVVLAPVFAILLSVGLISFLELVPATKWKTVLSTVLVLLVLGRFYQVANANSEAVASALIDNVEMKQTVYENYYLGDFFKQDQSMALLALEARTDTVYRYKHYDEPSCELYLAKNGVNHRTFGSMEELLNAAHDKQEVLLVTCSVNEVLSFLNERKIDNELLTPEPSFSNVIRCRMND